MTSAGFDSGTIKLVGQELVYSLAGVEAWRLALADIRLVAEYTNQDGPELDDYFYVFAAGRQCRFYEAPMYAGPGVLEEIGPALGCALQAELANSTTFKSRVVWPAALADHPFYAYTRSRRGPGVWNWIKDRIVPLVRSELTSEVSAYLREGAA